MSFAHATELTGAVKRGAPWLAAVGENSDVVISSRVRLARNLAGFPFISKASRSQRKEILEACRERVQWIRAGERVLWIDVHEASQLNRTLMVERHLISKEHARGIIPGVTKEEPESETTKNDARGAAVSMPDETVSIMINEEDHLRLQALVSGLELSEAFRRINEIDDRLENVGGTGMSAPMQFAYSPRFGYLTCCPTNVGTGVRVSVMLHLPALKLTGEIEKVKRATRDMSIAVRGYYGEGSEAAGDLYQISNQTTLGKPESVILHDIEREIVPQIIGYERAARKTLVEKRRRMVEDRVFRSLGTLRHARLLTPEEAITMLSDVRLGIVSGLIQGLNERVVNQLILLTQPAHLQVLVGREMDQGQRREARADLVRGQLGM